MDLSEKDKRGLKIFSVVAVVLALLFIARFQLSTDVDPVTLCAGEVPNRAYHTVIIDRTDQFDNGQINGIVRYIESEVVNEEMKEQDRLTIFTLDRENFINKGHAVPDPKYSKCFPGDPKKFNPIYESKRLLEDKYAAFIDSLDKVKQGLSEKDSASQTPILEMINSVSEEIDPARETHFYIISDMIHNNSYYSQYTESISFEEFKDRYEEYYNSIRPNLDNVNVKLLYLLRDKYRNTQTLSHENFWKKYFMDNNVNGFYMKRL